MALAADADLMVEIALREETSAVPDMVPAMWATRRDANASLRP
jgi:hypothetical protein